MNILFTPRFEKPILEGTKIHTIRSNYDYWKRKADGKECSFRVWTGKPRRSPQREFYRGVIHVQKIKMSHVAGIVKVRDTNFVVPFAPSFHLGDYPSIKIDTHLIAKNDGLTYNDLVRCFIYEPSELEMAILHWTDFRY